MSVGEQDTSVLIAGEGEPSPLDELEADLRAEAPGSGVVELSILPLEIEHIEIGSTE